MSKTDKKQKYQDQMTRLVKNLEEVDSKMDTLKVKKEELNAKKTLLEGKIKKL